MTCVFLFLNYKLMVLNIVSVAYSCYPLMFKLSYLWRVEAYSRWLWSPVDMISVVIDTFLAFWQDKMLQTYLEYFLIQIWNQPFCLRILVPLSGAWYLEITVSALGVLVTSSSDFVSRPFK